MSNNRDTVFRINRRIVSRFCEVSADLVRGKLRLISERIRNFCEVQNTRDVSSDIARSFSLFVSQRVTRRTCRQRAYTQARTWILVCTEDISSVIVRRGTGFHREFSLAQLHRTPIASRLLGRDHHGRQDRARVHARDDPTALFVLCLRPLSDCQTAVQMGMGSQEILRAAAAGPAADMSDRQQPRHAFLRENQGEKMTPRIGDRFCVVTRERRQGGVSKY